MSSQPTIGISEGRCTRTTFSMLQSRQSSQHGKSTSANRTQQKPITTRPETLAALRRSQKAERWRIPGGSAIYTRRKTARVQLLNCRFKNQKSAEILKGEDSGSRTVREVKQIGQMESENRRIGEREKNGGRTKDR